jgi:hypothetical protein
MPTSNWREATRGYQEQRELVRLVVQLIQEYYIHWGRWPSADELIAQVRGS